MWRQPRATALQQWPPLRGSFGPPGPKWLSSHSCDNITALCRPGCPRRAGTREGRGASSCARYEIIITLFTPNNHDSGLSLSLSLREATLTEVCSHFLLPCSSGQHPGPLSSNSCPRSRFPPHPHQFIFFQFQKRMSVSVKILPWSLECFTCFMARVCREAE